jgi:hypothetical protein
MKLYPSSKSQPLLWSRNYSPFTKHEGHYRILNSQSMFPIISQLNAVHMLPHISLISTSSITLRNMEDHLLLAIRCNYPRYMKAVSSIRNQRTRHEMGVKRSKDKGEVVPEGVWGSGGIVPPFLTLTINEGE